MPSIQYSIDHGPKASLRMSEHAEHILERLRKDEINEEGSAILATRNQGAAFSLSITLELTSSKECESSQENDNG